MTPDDQRMAAAEREIERMRVRQDGHGDRIRVLESNAAATQVKLDNIAADVAETNQNMKGFVEDVKGVRTRLLVAALAFASMFVGFGFTILAAVRF